MISPRFLFVGDPTEAVKYVGIAKKFAINTYQTGIISKVWHVGSQVSIRVMNNLQSGICKVWIEASPPSFPEGYQFYTTSPTVQWAIDTDEDNDFFPGGSAVFVPTPKKIDISGTPTYVVKAAAKGSLVEVPPTFNEVPLWNYSPMPDALVGEDQLNQKMQTELFMVKGAWQINGLPQYVYYHCEGTKPVSSVFQSWVQAKGQVHGCGAIVPIDYKYVTDFLYDAAPANLTKKKKIEYFVPDTDWFGRGTVQYVTHPDYGTRQFYITSDTQDIWYCYPMSGFTVDVEEYASEYFAYGDQGYKANIIPNHAKTDTPEYPTWVSPSVAWRDLYIEDSERLILEPRYSWSFNQNGTRAISVMIEREDSECTFAEVDYAPDDLGTAVYNAKYAMEIWNVPYSYAPFDSPHIPTEEAIDEILIDQSENLGNSSDPKSTQQDRRGWVELEFLVVLTGPNIEDFTFEVSILNEYSPDDLLALDRGVLVEVAYAMPMQWDISGFGVRSLTDSGFTVQTDDVLSVWMELYRHQEQIDLIGAYDGEVSMNEPSKAKAFFYKGNKPNNLSELFVLPLYQAHGEGYTFAQQRNYGCATLYSPASSGSRVITVLLNDEDDVIILPGDDISIASGSNYEEFTVGFTSQAGRILTVNISGNLINNYPAGNTTVCSEFKIPLAPEPHLFVRQTCQSFTSRYPWKPLENESPELYTYDANITHLDLRSLSFYYTVRLLEQNHDDEAYDETGGVYIRNKAKTWCAVCVMGKIVQEESVGHEDLLVNWIQGWAKEAGSAGLDEDEFLTPPDLIGNLRGCGFLSRNTLIEYQTPTIPSGTTNENYYMASDVWGRKSWVNSNYMQLNPLKTRGQYTNTYIDELPVPPWFMIGPCGHIFNYALSRCLLLETYPSGQAVINWGLGATTTLNFTAFKNINDIVKDDVGDFISSIYNDFYNYSMELIEIDAGYNISASATLDSIYQQNPYELGNPDLSLVSFIEQASGYIWKLIQSVQKYTPYIILSEVDAVYTTWGFVSLLPTYIDHFVFPRGGGLVQYKNQNRLIDPVANLTTREQFRKQKIVKNFELGNLYYNTAIVQHFTPSPMHAKDAIQVTPEGHYSFARKDLFEISKEYCTQDVKYYNDKLRFADINGLYDFSEGAMPLILRYEPIPAQGLTVADMDWKLLEGIHWFYGLVKTTHLATYNLAYQQAAPESKKPYLLSKEEYENYYSKADFKPDFKFLTYNNYLWVYPGEAEDGQPIAAIYRSLKSSHNTSILLYPKFDGRNKRSSIRLSPLFFS